MQQPSLRRLWVLALPIILALLSLGCGLSGVLSSSTPTRAATRRPLPTFTPTPVMVMVNTATPAPTAAPTESITTTPVEPSPTPPPADTPTPVSNEVTINIPQAMNVRSGPGTNYPVIGPAPAGSSAKVLGRNADSSWLQVEYPPSSGNKGWLSANLVKLTGQVEAVAVAQAPAAPPPAPTQPAKQPEKQAPTPALEKKFQFTAGSWSASKNEAICHFRGTIRDEGGRPVHGYSVVLDNGSYSVISHPSSASHHYAQVDGQWDISGIPLKDCIGTWNMFVARYDCPDFQTRFDAQCKQFTRLSDIFKIEVNYPNETVIWADWVCHSDCNKGVYSQPYRK